jgi:MFS transporter, CP family, cyanate transporter
MHGPWIVFWVAILGFTGALTLILALALPSVLSAPDDVHRTSAGMFTISYNLAMALSVVGGWLWDVTHSPIAGFIPVAVCALLIIVLASTVRHADRQPGAAGSISDRERAARSRIGGAHKTLRRDHDRIG